MPSGYPGGSSTFVPSLEATKYMQIEFSRNPRDFALPRYVKYVPVTKTAGLYTEIGREEAARYQHAGVDHYWADGADAPSGNDGHETFEFKAYRTIRRAYAFRLGDLGVKQAEWDVLASYGRIKAQQAMTVRTCETLALLQNTSNWATGHTSAITGGTISGTTGKWDVSTTARSDIKRSLDHGIETIILSSLGVVKAEDLQLVVSLKCARQMSESQEIIDYMKGSYVAEQRIRGEGDNVEFVLPAMLYGLPVVVERTVKVTNNKIATRASSFAMDNVKPFIAARPGGLQGAEGVPEFSTASVFIYSEDDMTVEQKHDDDNRVHKGRVVDHFAAVMTASVTGFLFQDAVAA